MPKLDRIEYVKTVSSNFSINGNLQDYNVFATTSITIGLPSNVQTGFRCRVKALSGYLTFTFENCLVNNKLNGENSSTGWTDVWLFYNGNGVWDIYPFVEDDPLPIPPAPLAAYQFDNASDLGEDSSGNGYHLTNVNGVTQVTGTGIGKGYGANFVAASSQRLLLPVFFDTAKDFSVCSFMQANDTPSGKSGRLVSVWGASPNRAFNLQWGTYPEFQYRPYIGTRVNTSAMVIGAYFGVAVAYTLGEMACYSNGWCIGSSTDAILSTTTTDFILGGEVSGFGYWDGIVAQTFVFDCKLSDSQVAYLHNNGHGRIWTGSEWI